MGTHDVKVHQNGDRIKLVWSRTPEQKEEMEKLRLGPFAEMEPMTTSIFTAVLPKKNMVFISDYYTAQRAIGTRLRLDKRPHKILTGTQLVSSYLGKGEDGGSDEYFEGFPVFKQLYVLFGYMESKNRRLAELINELVSMRYHQKLHCWLFINCPLEILAPRWGEVLLNLKFLPSTKLDPAKGHDGPKATSASSIQESPPQEYRPDRKLGNIQPPNNATIKPHDRKFGKK
jgi:hypothetical protein